MLYLFCSLNSFSIFHSILDLNLIFCFSRLFCSVEYSFHLNLMTRIFSRLNWTPEWIWISISPKINLVNIRVTNKLSDAFKLIVRFDSFHTLFIYFTVFSHFNLLLRIIDFQQGQFYRNIYVWKHYNHIRNPLQTEAFKWKYGH